MAKEKKISIPEKGKIYIYATFNNTIIAITNESSQVLFSGSAGSSGFKGSRKSTPFAATTAVKNITEKAKNAGLKRVDVFLKGPGWGRDAAVKAVKASGLQILSLADVTPMPHNGPRPKKRRRV